jgi:DNA-3-methyladenine glycosylase II
MRTTRSSSRHAAASKMLDTPTATPSTLGKREADTELAKNTKKIARQEAASDAEQPQPASDATLVPAVLTFDFQEAKRHLIQADHRFEDLFQRMTCKPFEQLERVHPFRYGFWYLS